MGLRKCKECGNEVSTEAASCPKCGAVTKKKTGLLGYIGAAFLILIGGIHLTQATPTYSILGRGNLSRTHICDVAEPGRRDSYGRVGRLQQLEQTQLHAQQDVATTAVPYRQLVGGNHKI